MVVKTNDPAKAWELLRQPLFLVLHRGPRSPARKLPGGHVRHPRRSGPTCHQAGGQAQRVQSAAGQASAHAIESARRSYAIINASRPYHNDPLVSHDLPKCFPTWAFRAPSTPSPASPTSTCRQAASTS